MSKALRLLILPAVFVAVALLALGTATLAVGAIERHSAKAVRGALLLEGQDWVQVRADGLQLHLSGMAETEALRFRALTVAAREVDAARLIDAMEVRPAAGLRAPDFSVEILRNDDGVSLIGLLPASEDRDALLGMVGQIASGAQVSDMLETAAWPAPDGWEQALSFGLQALERLPRSKISIAPQRVAAIAITSSASEKARLESELARLAPPGLALELDLSAPRPVLTPFTLRFLIDADGARFDACSADTEQARTQILAAAVAAGLQGKSDCTVGLGTPSVRWADAVAAGIAAVAELGGGTLTFSDADVSLIGPEGGDQGAFDRIAGELERALPAAFSLTSVLPPRPDAAAPQGPPEFTATRSPEGQVQMRGRLPDEAVRSVVESYALARFGMGNAYLAARLTPDLPDGWAVRVLAALESLAELDRGSALVRPDLVRIQGRSGNPQAGAEIARLLAAKLGEGAAFDIDVGYDAALDPASALPTPQECVDRVNAVLAERKIGFDPGSADVAAESIPVLDRLAEALDDCDTVQMEIGAHSDSQGREEMNLALSQRRADAVLSALLARRVPVSNIRAMGYGEANPIADNGTEEGREANRRIEFTLILPEEEPAAEDAAEDAGAGEASEQD